MIKEFKEFAMKGNMVDMAIGIIIGAAFGTVVKSVVSDILMPVISAVTGAPDFSNLFMILRAPAETGVNLESIEAVREAGGVPGMGTLLEVQVLPKAGHTRCSYPDRGFSRSPRYTD